MKQCLFCAEEIQDAATLCRFCNRPVLVSADSISYQSGAFALGKTTDGRYAVWNASTGGPPIETFVAGEEGWRVAWARWQQYTGPPAPAVGAAQVQYVAAPNNGKAIAALVLGIVWLYGLGSILALIFGYQARKEIEASGNIQQGKGMATAGIVLGWVGVGGIALLVVVVIIAAASSTGASYPNY